MSDAYWCAKDEFEHDIRELFGNYISPEEFETKWRPRLKDEIRLKLKIRKFITRAREKEASQE